MKEIFLLFGNQKERFHFAILYSIEGKNPSRCRSTSMYLTLFMTMQSSDPLYICNTYIIIKNPFTRVKTFQIKANVDNRNETNLALELVFPTTHRVNEFFAGSVRYKIGFYEGGHILYFFVVQRKHMFLLTYSKQSTMFLNGNIHMAQNHVYTVLFNSK